MKGLADSAFTARVADSGLFELITSCLSAKTF